MKVGVIGAAGPVGMNVTLQALDTGHHVQALSYQHNSTKMGNVNDPHFQIKRIDDVSDDSLARALTGCEAVLACHGLKKDLVDTQLIISIVNAMRRCKISRLVILGDSSNPVSGRVKCFSCCGSSATMHHYLEDTCDDLDWTLVKPPQLIDGPPVAGSCFAQEGDRLPNVRAKISVMNVAEYLIEQLTETAWHKKTIYIMPPKQAISI